MATKKEKRLTRAAEARALLGLDDEPAHTPNEPEPTKPARPVVPRKYADGPTRPKRTRGGADNNDRVPIPESKRPVVLAGAEGHVASSGSERPEVLTTTVSIGALVFGDGRPDPLAPWKSGIDPKHFPKKHTEGVLKRGDTVWYRGERFWVEYANDRWHKGVYVRISDRVVHPDPTRPLPSDMEKSGVLTFCVHADCLQIAQPPKSLYAKPPTMADSARQERAAKGIKDIGDPVAVLLRDAKGLDEVYKAGAKYLDIAVPVLKAKYGHLNPGQQRMNIGNRMRAKWRKEGGHV